MRDRLNKYTISRKQLSLIYSLGLEESIKINMEKLAKGNGFEKITWIQGGPTISTHAGTGCFGIAGIEN